MASGVYLIHLTPNNPQHPRLTKDFLLGTYTLHYSRTLQCTSDYINIHPPTHTKNFQVGLAGQVRRFKLISFLIVKDADLKLSGLTKSQASMPG
jgi:hypothetical protein